MIKAAFLTLFCCFLGGSLILPAHVFGRGIPGGGIMRWGVNQAVEEATESAFEKAVEKTLYEGAKYGISKAKSKKSSNDVQSRPVSDLEENTK